MAQTAVALRLAEPADEAGAVPSAAYDQALHLARTIHAGQFRKSGGGPYLSHLLQVSGLVFEYGGDETQAIAGLLHDAIEDQADAQGGAPRLRGLIAARFGASVLHLVEICSDCESKPKPPWLLRKQRHLQRLARASPYECLVPACDKLHNLRCINADLHAGRDPFRVLKGGPRDQIWCYTASTELFAGKGLAAAADLGAELEQMRRLADRRGLLVVDQELAIAD